MSRFAGVTPTSWGRRRRLLGSSLALVAALVAPTPLSSAQDSSADSLAPTRPPHLRAISWGHASVGLRWGASEDDTAVTEYRILRDGRRVATVSGDTLMYLDEGLTPDTRYRYTVRAADAAGNVSTRALRLAPTTLPAGRDPVLVGAGDIGKCGKRDDERTARLLRRPRTTIFTVGDNVYPNGSPHNFARCYGPSWGRFRARTMPAVGNHEYQTPGARGYFRYFGSAAGDRGKGYYSYDVGTWHLIVLNSNCHRVGGCYAHTPQVRWLRADLNATPRQNIAAFWHHPWVTHGTRSPAAMKRVWRILYEHGAEFVVSGHDHTYERLAPVDPGRRVDRAHGIRSFTVGTGGDSLSRRSVTSPLSRAFKPSYGVIRLTLHPHSYEWEFLPVRGRRVFDAGRARVHGPPTG